MGIFGPGVGGGMLAAAGAVGGLGQGLTQVGQQQQKVNLEEHLNDLQTKREETITRLQQQGQSQLEEQRAGHEEARTEKEIAGHSAVAHFERESVESEAAKGRQFSGEQGAAHRASQEKIGAAHDAARVAAAQAHTPAPKTVKEWTPRTMNLQGSFDPVSHAMIPGRSMNVMVHRDGSAWVQVGDKLLPYDASKPDGLSGPPESLARAPAPAVQALLNNPLGTVPGTNTPMKDSFVGRYGYLPQSYLTTSQAARDKATATPARGASGGGGGDTEQATAPENEDPAETEEDTPPTGQ